jgi:hypothetical protein
MMTILALLAAAASPAPQPSELKVFEDWTVGCDNGRACHAVALMAEDWPDEGLTMSVRRGPEAEAAPVIGFDLGGDSGAASLAADGKDLPVRLATREGMAEVAGDDSAAAIAALRSAAELQLLAADGKPLGTVTLKGASAALLYMDERQGRVGTGTALVRPGPKPASAVPAPPPLPVVRSAVAAGARPLAFAAARIAALRKSLGCEIGEVGGPEHHEIFALDARRSLLLLACGSGAYNLSFVPVLAEAAGATIRTRLAPFDAEEPWWKEEGKPILVNAGWDSEQGLLTSFSKGRGLGDCGTGREHAWDGARFRLVRQFEMGECRGSLDYIDTWRATVLR